MNILNKIKLLLPINYKMVATLYSLSEKSLLTLILLSLAISYFFYPIVGFKIILWNLLLLVLIYYRFFHAILFKNKPNKFTLDSWYQKFAVTAILTAFLFGILPVFIFFAETHLETHLLLVIMLLGLSAGSSTSLEPDYRIDMGYTLAIMLPLLICAFMQFEQIYYLLTFLIFIYLASKLLVIVQGHTQQRKILQQEEQIEKVEKALHEKQDLIYHFVEEAPLAIFSYDTDLNIIETNHTLQKMFQLTEDETLNLNLYDMPDTRIIEIMDKALTSGSYVYNGHYSSAQGLNFWLEIICFTFNNNEGDVVGGIGIINDKTKEHTAMTTLEFNAKHDLLTSLLNRRGFKEYIKLLTEKDEHQYFYSLLFYLDLNKFKQINDSLGHGAGDELLIEISKRLQKNVTKECIVSRVGGDEFIIIYPFISESKIVTESFGKKCIERIQKSFKESFLINDIQLIMQTSIGIVTIEPNELDIDEVIRHADIAMFQAKKSHTNKTSYYSTKLDEERKKLFHLQHDLVYAIEKNQLKLYLQPLVAMQTDKVLAAEALLRLEHPTRGMLSPIEFISISIETGLIADITWWLLEEICTYISELKKLELWNLDYISININARQLLISHFSEKFLSTIEKFDLNASDIMIEVTERSLIDNFEDTQDVLSILRKEGIKCAIDDFGIGYSSLSYLKKLSFDTLKIDREFVKDIQERPDDIKLIKTILDIGEQFNYHIVVEGIEELIQKELLLEINKDLTYQGFLFSKAIPTMLFTERYIKNS